MPAFNAQRQGLALIELISVILGILIGIRVGVWITYQTQSVAFGILGGVLAVPVSFLVIAYGFMFCVCCLIALRGRTHPRDEYFGDL